MPALARQVATGIGKLERLAIRFGIGSLPADLLSTCDDVLVAALAIIG
jgi:hypothetical protein